MCLVSLVMWVRFGWVLGNRVGLNVFKFGGYVLELESCWLFVVWYVVVSYFWWRGIILLGLLLWLFVDDDIGILFGVFEGIDVIV